MCTFLIFSVFMWGVLLNVVYCVLHAILVFYHYLSLLGVFRMFYSTFYARNNIDRDQKGSFLIISGSSTPKVHGGGSTDLVSHMFCAFFNSFALFLSENILCHTHFLAFTLFVIETRERQEKMRHVHFPPFFLSFHFPRQKRHVLIETNDEKH